jgi:hypothetical protein
MTLRPTDPLPPPTRDLPGAILGLWRLVAREDHDAEGTRHVDPVLGADPLGMLSFSPGHFAAQFSRRDRTTQGAGTGGGAGPGANNSAAVDGYDAYFGRYTLDGAAGTITTTLEGSVAAANVGKLFVREIRVVEGRLIIQLATTSAAGVAVTRRLTFARAG